MTKDSVRAQASSRVLCQVFGIHRVFLKTSGIAILTDSIGAETLIGTGALTEGVILTEIGILTGAFPEDLINEGLETVLLLRIWEAIALAGDSAIREVSLIPGDSVGMDSACAADKQICYTPEPLGIPAFFDIFMKLDCHPLDQGGFFSINCVIALFEPTVGQKGAFFVPGKKGGRP